MNRVSHRIKGIFLFIFIIMLGMANAQSIKLAKLKYNGGGDWYANKTALPNLIKFCKPLSGHEYGC